MCIERVKFLSDITRQILMTTLHAVNLMAQPENFTGLFQGLDQLNSEMANAAREFFSRLDNIHCLPDWTVLLATQ
jgi:hypothetical protein